MRELQRERQKTEEMSSIRVHSSKLDKLVDLVGEIVTVQARLSQVAGTANNATLLSIAEEVERRTAHLRVPINIAVMGCAVNGPGEAAGAEIGIVAGDGEGLIYINGKIARKVKEDQMVAELMKEIEARWGSGGGEVGNASTVGRWTEKHES